MSSSYAKLQQLAHPVLNQQKITISVLRLDLHQPLLSGNKYFKLKYNLEQARQQGYKQVLSFGGAFSNHLHALAMAGQQYGLATVGVVRGEKTSPLNATLQDASDAGMELCYVSREEYRKRNNSEYLDRLQQRYPDSIIIPEGGSNLLGVKGCMEIVDHIWQGIGNDFDTIILPCGTAATLAGIAAAAVNKRVIGISVLKNANFLEDSVNDFHRQLGIDTLDNWQLLHTFHGGGYARVSAALAEFIRDFHHQYAIELEPVYSGKMFYALLQLLNEGYFARGSKIVAIHTGGLQGLRGMQHKLEKLLPA